MKRIKKFGLILSLIAVAFGLNSCLNDDNINDQKYGLINLDANKIIELPSNASHVVSKTLLPSGIVDVTIGEVRLAAENSATEDLIITLSSDTTGVFTNGELIFPSDKVVIPTSLTIPKGERSVPLIVKINTEFLLPDPQYIAISIKNVDKEGYIISGNFGVLKANFKIKHKYEGRYVLTGTMDHLPSLGAYVHITNLFDPDPYTVQLQTVDGSTLIFYEEMGWGDYIYPIMTAAGGYSGWGSFCPEFKFDSEGNVISVTNAYGQPAGNTRSAVLDPTGVNKYDETTKSFKVSYFMVQPSVVTSPPHYRCHMVETYTFEEDL